MAENKDYEFLPEKEIKNLKKEIESLKKHSVSEGTDGNTLLEAVNNLNDSIRRLIDIFTQAQADLSEQYEGTSPVEDLKEIKDQNEQIARGLVAVADIVKDMKGQIQPISPGPKIPRPHPSSPVPPPEVPEPVLRASSDMPAEAIPDIPLEQPFGEPPTRNLGPVPVPPPPGPFPGLPPGSPLGSSAPGRLPLGPPSMKAPPRKRRGLFSRK